MKYFQVKNNNNKMSIMCIMNIVGKRISNSHLIYLSLSVSRFFVNFVLSRPIAAPHNYTHVTYEN